jgi:hypothetical protein
MDLCGSVRVCPDSMKARQALIVMKSIGADVLQKWPFDQARIVVHRFGANCESLNLKTCPKWAANVLRLLTGKCLDSSCEVVSGGGVGRDRPCLLLVWLCRPISTLVVCWRRSDLTSDYSVITKGYGRIRTLWGWEIQKRSRPLGVKLCKQGFRSKQAAKLAGEGALMELLDGIFRKQLRD